MTSCDRALLNITRDNLITRFDNMNYRIQRNKAFVDYQKYKIIYEKQKQDEINKRNIEIDNQFSSGYYILKSYPGIPQAALDSAGYTSDFWSRFVAFRGAKETCPNGGFGGCCTTGGTEADHKCCALNKYRVCNPCFGDCGGWDGSEDRSDYAAKSRLNTNIFSSYMNNLKNQETIRITNYYDSLIKLKQDVYESILPPPPPQPVSVNCCQSIISSNISANAVTIDNNMKCTVNDKIQNAFKSWNLKK